MTEPTSCQSSIQAHEPVFATATEASVWMCLEYRAAWAAKAFEASHLPAGVKSRLSKALDAAPGTRLQLIRRPGRTRGPLTLYLAQWDPLRPRAYRLDFDGYGELAGLDFPALAAGIPPKAAREERTAWVLICGNGRRDVCCARHGAASYRTLAGRVPAEVWLSDHQGGHRFAGNGWLLPAGIQLGRLTPATARRVVNTCLQGGWDFDHIRGHAAYAPAAQAAEHFLRQRLGLSGANDLRLVSAAADSDTTWQVTFSLVQTGQEHTLRIAEEPSGFEVFKTTGDAAASPVSLFRVI